MTTQSEIGMLTLTALWDGPPGEDVTGLRCEQADPLIAVAPELWDMATRGELVFTEAGEGLFAITTVNRGVLRYALTGETTFGNALVAKRLERPGG